MVHSAFFRRLFLPYLLLICASIVAVGFFGAMRLRATYMNGRRQELGAELLLCADLIRDDLRPGRFEQLQRRITTIGQEIACRITVVAGDGTVLADNWADPAKMENHGKRPEIITALREGEAYSERASDTIHQDMLYLARRLTGPGDMVYYLRLALKLKDMDGELRLLYAGLGGVAVVAMLLAGGIGYHFARRQAAPVLELKSVADALSRGELERRSGLTAGGELGALGAALNGMADAIQSLLAQATKDKAELLTILSSMNEGVIATDASQRILLVNDAAAQLLGFDAHGVRGKPLWQVVRADRLIKAAGEVLATGERKTFDPGRIAARHLEVCLSTYPANAKAQGLIVVVHDTTQSVRYQEMRKEFVANVSHELRTPLTVIKGFVETLRDGALQDPVKGPQYLATIERHTNQLTNLVSDLLELSKLESHAELPRRVSVDLAAVIARTVDSFMPAAQKKRQAISQNLGFLPAVAGNPDYLERAVANLLENAIKYTPEGGKITITARSRDDSAIVEVTDNGIGIPLEDQPRIFERFYRVDRSRSREMGGTGLGLAIVKHIVQVHGGTVEVESVPGAGSTFRFKLPALKREEGMRPLLAEA